MEHKKLLKAKHQCTFFYNMNFFNFNPFLGIFAALRPSLFFVMGAEVRLVRCDSYGNFGYLKNIYIYYSKRNLEKNTLSSYWNHCSAPLPIYSRKKAKKQQQQKSIEGEEKYI